MLVALVLFMTMWPDAAVFLCAWNGFRRDKSHALARRTCVPSSVCRFARPVAARVCRQRLAREPRRVAWYPGSTQKAEAFRSSLPGIEELGAAAPADAGAPPQAYLPWLFKAGLSPEEVCESLSASCCRHMAGACM